MFCFLQRLTAHLHSRKAPPYVINLDPAVHEVPFPANIGEDGSISWTHTTHTVNSGSLYHIIQLQWLQHFPHLVWLFYTELVRGAPERQFFVPPALCVLQSSVFPPPDIRDTVNYKEVMKQYGLGPNGGIVTSLNLFATRFDQVTQSDSTNCFNKINELINQRSELFKLKLWTV